jgi:hypothetical protein
MAAPPDPVDAACPRPSFPSSSLFLAPLCSSLLLGGPGHTAGPIAAALRSTNSNPPTFRTHTGYHWFSLPMSIASISRASSCLPTLYSVPIHSTKGCTRDTGCGHRQTKPSRGVRAVSLCFQSPQPHSRPRARCAGSLDRLPLSPTVSSSRSSLALWTLDARRSTLDAFPRARSRQEAVRMPKASTSATYVWMLGN